MYLETVQEVKFPSHCDGGHHCVVYSITMITNKGQKTMGYGQRRNGRILNMRYLGGRIPREIPNLGTASRTADFAFACMLGLPRSAKVPLAENLLLVPLDIAQAEQNISSSFRLLPRTPFLDD